MAAPNVTAMASEKLKALTRAIATSSETERYTEAKLKLGQEKRNVQ
jgi:hypothetical protein